MEGWTNLSNRLVSFFPVGFSKKHIQLMSWWNGRMIGRLRGASFWSHPWTTGTLGQEPHCGAKYGFCLPFYGCSVGEIAEFVRKICQNLLVDIPISSTDIICVCKVEAGFVYENFLTSLCGRQPGSTENGNAICMYVVNVGNVMYVMYLMYVVYLMYVM